MREDADWVWVLDPIDGTKSFITGKPLFGTLIGLLYKGVPVAGVIDQCVLDERWVGLTATKADGTVLRQTLLNGTPVAARGTAALGQAMMYATTVCDSPSTWPSRHPRFLEQRAVRTSQQAHV